MSAIGTYDDGSTKTLTSGVFWSSDDENVAPITSGGRVTGASSGTATITASAGAQSGTSTVTVTLNNVTAITIMPPSLTIARGNTGTLTVFATAGGTQVDVTATVTWTITDSSGNQATTHQHHDPNESGGDYGSKHRPDRTIHGDCHLFRKHHLYQIDHTDSQLKFGFRLHPRGAQRPFHFPLRPPVMFLCPPSQAILNSRAILNDEPGAPFLAHVARSGASARTNPSSCDVILSPKGRRIWRVVASLWIRARFLSRLKTAGLRNRRHLRRADHVQH